MFGGLVFDFLLKEKHSKEVSYATQDQKGVYKLDLEHDSLWNKYKGKNFEEELSFLQKVSDKKESATLNQLEKFKKGLKSLALDQLKELTTSLEEGGEKLNGLEKKTDTILNDLRKRRIKLNDADIGDNMKARKD